MVLVAEAKAMRGIESFIVESLMGREANSSVVVVVVVVVVLLLLT